MKKNQYSGTIKAQVGTYVEVDSWGHGAQLIDCPEWDLADFRLPGLADYAVNIEVTGRTIRYPWGRYGGPAVRVLVTFVGDCEPDQFARGWMAVSAYNREI